MNEPIPQDVATQLQEALREGNKIQAIKIYREYSGAGLAEAKEFIEMHADQIIAGGPVEGPGRGSSTPVAGGSPVRSGGCGVSTFILAAIIGGSSLVWLLSR